MTDTLTCLESETLHAITPEDEKNMLGIFSEGLEVMDSNFLLILRFWKLSTPFGSQLGVSTTDCDIF